MSDKVLVIGNFDGVHLGHQALLSAAQQAGAHCEVLTFWPHPMTVIRPDLAPKLLGSLALRERLLREAGVSRVHVVPFDEELAQCSPEDFVQRFILPLAPTTVAVGENFRFGHRALGSTETLRDLCSEHGIDVHVVPLLATGPGVASSTAIRAALADGDVVRAEALLGRPFAFEGTVVRGKQRGRVMLGMPTANLLVDAGCAVPSDGVYAGWTTRLDQPDAPRWPSAISVGTNPTFGDVARTVESYVLDRDDLELYGVDIRVEFTHRLRGMVKFEGLPGLRLQMEADVRQARSLLGAS